MFKTKLKTAAFAMSYLSSAERVRELVELLDLPEAKPLPYVGTAGVKVTAVRMEARSYRKLKEYVADINRYVAEAAAAGCHLVAFPELSGMLPVSLMPRFGSMLADWKGFGGSAQERAAMFAVACETVQGFVSEVFLNTFSQLAAAHRVVIAAGSIYQVEGGKIYNRQYLFSEEGEVAGMQDKLFLSPPERAVGVEPGERLTPAHTRVGQVALLCAREAAHYEPFAVAAAMGCSIVTAGASPYGEDASAARFRAQEQLICVITPGCSGGRELGLRLNAPAAVYAPRAVTRGRDGIVALAREGRSITARVDLLRAARQFDTYAADKNPEFYRALLR